MESILKEYIGNLIYITLGFDPIVIVEKYNEGVFNVSLNGDEVQRKRMMGKQAQNLIAFNNVSRVFARQHNIYINIHVERPDTHADTTHTGQNQG